MDEKLNFEDYPNITPTPPQDIVIQVETRSRGIKLIKSIMENLIKAMNSYVVDLQELDAKARMMEQQKEELILIEKQVRYDHLQLEKKEAEIKGQLKYIETWNKEHGS